MIKGKGFRRALRYNIEKVEKGVAEVLDHSFVEATEKSIMKEIQMIKVLRPSLQKCFYHTSINFPPAEDLSNKVMTQIGQDYLKESGFTQHQYIMFRHHDSDHPHLHILVNRIGYDGKVLSDSNDFARCEKILRDLEMKYNLTQVISSSQARQRAMTKNELEMMKRTNIPSHKMQLQVLIKNTLASKKKLTSSEFILALQSKGINVLFNQASTGYVSGISYSIDGITITGAKLGSDFKWTTIKNTIDYEQERDSQTIHNANARTKSSYLDTGRNSTNHPGNSTTLQASRTNQQGQQPKSKTTPHLDSGTNEQIPNPKQSTRSTHRKDDNNVSYIQQKSEGLNLATLLDGHHHGDIIHADHQPDLDFHLTSKKRRKKRRYLRK